MRSGAQTAGRRLQAQHEAQQRAEERTVRRRAEAVALVRQQTVEGEGWLRDRAALDGVGGERWPKASLGTTAPAGGWMAESPTSTLVPGSETPGRPLVRGVCIRGTVRSPPFRFTKAWARTRTRRTVTPSVQDVTLTIPL